MYTVGASPRSLDTASPLPRQRPRRLPRPNCPGPAGTEMPRPPLTTDVSQPCRSSTSYTTCGHRPRLPPRLRPSAPPCSPPRPRRRAGSLAWGDRASAALRTNPATSTRNTPPRPGFRERLLPLPNVCWRAVASSAVGQSKSKSKKSLSLSLSLSLFGHVDLLGCFGNTRACLISATEAREPVADSLDCLERSCSAGGLFKGTRPPTARSTRASQGPNGTRHGERLRTCMVPDIAVIGNSSCSSGRAAGPRRARAIPYYSHG